MNPYRNRGATLSAKGSTSGAEPLGPKTFTKEHPYDGSSQDFIAFRDQLLKEAMRHQVKNFHRATPADGAFYDANQPANMQRLVQDVPNTSTAKKMFLDAVFAADVPMAGVPPIPANLDPASIPLWSLHVKQDELNWKLHEAANASKRAAEATMIRYIREITKGSIISVLDHLIEEGRGTLPVILEELTQRYSNRHQQAVHAAALEKYLGPMEASNFHLLVDIRRQREIDFHKEARPPLPGNVYVPQNDEEVSFRIYNDLILALNGQSVLKIPAHYLEGLKNFEEDRDLEQCNTYVALLEKLKVHMNNIDRQRQKGGLKSSFVVARLDIMDEGMASTASTGGSNNNVRLNRAELTLVENFKRLDNASKQKFSASLDAARQSNVCFQYQKKGVCPRGDACPYEHVKNGAGAGPARGGAPKKEAASRSPGCTKEQRCGMVDCGVCLTAKLQAQTAAASRENSSQGGGARWEAPDASARFLCVQETPERLDVDVHKANIHRDNVSASAKLQLDSGCNSTAISPEGAEMLARRVDAVTRGPRCTTASDQILNVVGKAHMVSPFGAAHVVEGLKHNLSAVKDFTGRDCSVWFPSLDLGLKWGAYIYNSEGRVVAVADQADYMMEPLVMQEHIMGIPQVAHPNIFA